MLRLLDLLLSKTREKEGRPDYLGYNDFQIPTGSHRC